MGLLDKLSLYNLKKREEMQYYKMMDEEYYFSEESKVKGRQLYQDKKEYVKSNPEDFEVVGADIHSILWSSIGEMPLNERKIFRLTGEGKYYEDKGEYEKAIELYQKADNLTMSVFVDEIQELIREAGPGDYLYTKKIRQRIRVCEKAILKKEVNKLELEAKELEKINPNEAIKIYQELNKLKTWLKKYNKRIEICKKKIK